MIPEIVRKRSLVGALLGLFLTPDPCFLIPEVGYVHDPRDAAAGQEPILHDGAHDGVEIEGIDRVGEAALDEDGGEPAGGVFVVEAAFDVGARGLRVEGGLEGLDVGPEDVEAGEARAALRAIVAIALDDLARALDPGALLFFGDAFLGFPIGEGGRIAGPEIVLRLDAIANRCDVYYVVFS